MKTELDYFNMVKTHYENETPTMSINNHKQHNENPDYRDILLKPLQFGDWSDKKVLDYGCGCGRNVEYILENFNVGEAHGCDISQNNIKYCINYLNNKQFKNHNFFVTDGKHIDQEDKSYDMILSTIVLQHIPVYDVRFSILSEMYRCLKINGICSIQMGFGKGHPKTSTYYENSYNATSTNSGHDVQVDDENQLINDFKKIGFKDIEVVISNRWDDAHEYWIYVKGTK